MWSLGGVCTPGGRPASRASSDGGFASAASARASVAGGGLVERSFLAESPPQPQRASQTLARTGGNVDVGVLFIKRRLLFSSCLRFRVNIGVIRQALVVIIIPSL